MENTSDRRAKRFSSHPPAEYKKISGIYSVKEDTKILEVISRNDFSQFDLSNWINISTILKCFKTWSNLPLFIRDQIKFPLSEYIRNNMPLTNDQLQQQIWDLALPLLEVNDMEVEIEEEADTKAPGQYSVIDIKVVRTRKSVKEQTERIIGRSDSEPPTLKETPTAKTRPSR